MNFMPLRQTIAPQRASGRLDLAFRHDGATTRIAKLYQEGCLKARLPRPQSPGIREAILINIGGGIAGGDSLATSITLGPAASALLTTQAAERLYRALDAPARITTSLTLGPGAQLDYLPQETILFAGFALNRALEIDLAAESRLLGLEALVFGRQAMGETLTSGDLRDRITLRRDGQLILADMTRLAGDIAAQLRRPAVANGAGAMATLIYAAPDAPFRLTPLRAALAAAATTVAAATLIDGVIFARLLAPDAKSLRNTILAALRPLRDNRPTPRAWQS